MDSTIRLKPQQATFSPAARTGVGVVAALAALITGAATALGLSPVALVIVLCAPFILMLVLARPQWASLVYAVLVYGDLLSILVRYHGMPALARFAGVALLSAVLGYRLFVQREKLAGDHVTLWMLAYGAMIALGLLYARAPDLVINNLIEFVRNLFTYVIIINIITTSTRLHSVIYALLGCGTTFASLTIFQWLTGTFDNDYGGLAQYRVSDITSSTAGARPGGTLGDANYYGQLLLMMIPIAFYLMFEGRTRLGRLVGFSCASILTTAVILTYSRGDAIALGTIIIAGLIYKKPNPVWLVGGLLALMAIVPLLPPNYLARLTTIVNLAEGDQQLFNQDDSILGRTGATQAAVEMFLDHPTLGVGRENYPLYQLDYLAGTPYARIAKGIPLHDLYLEVASENGIVGLFIFGGFLLATAGALRDAWKRFKQAGLTREKELMVWLAIMLIGYLVSALSLHGAFLYILWLQISIIVAARQVARRTTLSPATVRAWEPQSQAQTPPPLQPAVPNVDGLPSENIWLAAADDALARGDTKVASAMVEMAFERDPRGDAAWGMWARVRQAEQGALAQASSNGSLAAAIMPSLRDAGGEAGPLHEIGENLYSYWHMNGGTPIFGLPISPTFAEVDSAGKTIEAQYFELARLEYRPDRAGTRFEVVTGKLGLEVPVRGRVAVQMPPGMEGEQVIFTATGRAMPTPRQFFSFWERNGGPDVLGYPTTPLLLDTVAESHQLAVQYFEKARLEYHPKLAGTLQEVQLSRLGVEVFARRYERKQ